MPLKKTILTATVVILLLLIPLLVLLSVSTSDEAEDEEGADAPSVLVLFDLNHSDHVERLSFVYGDRDPISISRTDDGWQITDRPGLPVNGDVVTPLLTLYEQILALRTITEDCNDPSEYGLDEPILTVTLTVEGEEKTYLFGDRNDYYEGYYCMIANTASVYLLDYAYLTAFDLTVEELVLTEKLPSLSTVSALQWISAEGTVADETDDLKTALATLTVDRMIDWGSEQYAVYGLDAAATATLTLSDGKTLTLRLSEGETEELIYLTIDDREIIYLVTCEEMQTLLDHIRMQ